VILQRLGPTTALIDPDCVTMAHEMLESFGIRNDLSFLHQKSLPEKKSENDRHPRVRENPSRTSSSTRLGQSTRRTREIVEDAIRKNQRVRLKYRAQTGGKMQERTVDPLDIERRHGVAYLTAYCHLRGEVQVFRIPSIVEIEVLGPRQEPRQ
jgi:predicted DNA-binding transcriptional regulator YafY